jgi:fatty-acyl-CoA synthase
MIISGGENIYPAEIENVLADCPEIVESAVVGRSDPRWGEAVVAVVVRAPGIHLTEGDVLRLFEGRIARFKHPKVVLFVERLPRTAVGKLHKEEIRRLVARGATA